MAGRGGPLVTLRGLVIADPVAIRGWSTVVDDIVNSPVERLRIKHKLEDGKHGGIEEGILRSLESFYSEGGTLDDLLSILRAQGLNALVGKSQPSPACQISDHSFEDT